jgi:hypothetical protein
MSGSPVIVQEKETPSLEAESTQSLTGKENMEFDASATTISTLTATSINSLEVLEKILIAIIRSMAIESKQDYVSVTKLKTRFHTQCKEPADSIVKKLLPGFSLIKFFRSRPTLFTLALVAKEHKVKLL